MATAGPRYPGTVATEVGPSGDNDWANPANVGADDGAEAQITAATYDAGDHSYRLKATNFGFDAEVPADSTINGITVEIDRRRFAGAAQDQEVRLYDSTATLVGDDKQTATAWPATLGIATYGGASDTWNAGLDAADIRSANFGVALIVLADAANTDIGVDFIRVTIDYTPPSPSGTGAVALPATTVAGTGSHVEPVSGTGAISLPSTTVVGTGAETFTATGALALAATTAAGVGEEVFTATGAPSLAAATVTGAGAEVFTATGAPSFAALTVAGAGDHTESGPPNPSGTGAPSLAAATVAGTGELVLTGTGAATLASVTVAGTGAETITGTGSIVLASISATGDGLHIQNATGTGAISLPVLAISGTGTGGATGGRVASSSHDDDDTVLSLLPFEVY